MYFTALNEVKSGRKVSHWMWFIFPQMKGLGHSSTAKYYSIANLEEAECYLAHPILSRHLIEISQALLNIENKTATEILGTPDDMEIKVGYDLILCCKQYPSVFGQVLNKYFSGIPDEKTLKNVTTKPGPIVLGL